MQRTASIAMITVIVSLSGVAHAEDAPPAQPPVSTQPLAPAQPPAPTQPLASSVQTVAPEAAEAILGRRVTNPDGKDVGRLVDVLVDENGRPQAAVIDFGGFMGVGNRKVAVHWSTLRFNPADGKHRITLGMTPDQIKAAPEYSNSDKPAPVVTPADATPQPR
jgi:hypothetical protein